MTTTSVFVTTINTEHGTDVMVSRDRAGAHQQAVLYMFNWMEDLVETDLDAAKQVLFALSSFNYEKAISLWNQHTEEFIEIDCLPVHATVQESKMEKNVHELLMPILAELEESA